jgi:hypothetical protein
MFIERVCLLSGHGFFGHFQHLNIGNSLANPNNDPLANLNITTGLCWFAINRHAAGIA